MRRDIICICDADPQAADGSMRSARSRLYYEDEADEQGAEQSDKGKKEMPQVTVCCIAGAASLLCTGCARN